MEHLIYALPRLYDSNLIKLTKKITKGEIDIKYGKPKQIFIVEIIKDIKVSKVKLSFDISRIKKTYLNYN